MNFLLRNPLLALLVTLLTALGIVGALTSTGAPRSPEWTGASQTGSKIDGRTVSDSITVSKNGAVIDAKYVKGVIAVQASNVTIKNTVVDTSSYHSIRIYPGANGTKIVDSAVKCRSSHTNGVVFGNYTANRVRLTGCRNDFMSSPEQPATVTNSWVDGKPFELNPTDPEPEPEPTQTPTNEPTNDPTSEPSDPEPSASASYSDSDFPTTRNTGPRYSSTRTTSSLKSSSRGQVISRVTVNGRLTIRHDDVTVRDVRVNGTGTYMIQVVEKADGTCPTNVRIQYTEVNGANAEENDIPLYSPRCGYRFDHGYIHNVGRTSRLVNNTTISNSYIFSSRTGSSGAHRGAVGTNGGRNNRIINNVLMCQGTGCSAAIPMYGDFAPVNGMLVQHNLLATTGSYCAYGGSVDSKPYPNGSNVRFLDNQFSTRYFDTCGRYGPISSFDNNVRGNVWSGNTWAESGRTVSAPR